MIKWGKKYVDISNTAFAMYDSLKKKQILWLGLIELWLYQINFCTPQSSEQV